MECRICKCDLVVKETWYKSSASKKDYICKQCHSQKVSKYLDVSLKGPRGERIRASRRVAAARYISKNPDKAKQYKSDPNYKRKQSVYSKKQRLLNPEKCKKWRDDWHERNQHKNAPYCRARKARILSAVPLWAREEKERIELVYKKAREYGMQVDHVIPLTHKNVCGLHCWDNLQLLSEFDNLSKKNYHWPDMWDG